MCILLAAEDCGNPSLAVNEILADDEALLSLIQVKAIATRNNRSLHSKQSRNASTELQNISSHLSGSIDNKRWRFFEEAKYLASAVILVIILVNSSWLCVLMYRQEISKKQ